MTGIDRIILNKIKINNFEELNKKSILTSYKSSEHFEHKDELCQLKQSYHLSANGKEFIVSSLDFNPNRVLRGDNIKNSSVKELIKALDIVISKLKEKGIDVDISEASIKYLEINKNIKLNFNHLKEVFLAIGRANFKKAFGFHSYTEEDIPHLIKRDRSLYINLRDIAYSPEHPEDSAILIAYDKTHEAYIKHNIELDEEITRVEMKLGRDYYRNELQKISRDNSLKTLLEHYELIDSLFKKTVKKLYIDKTINYINSVIRKNLEKDFIAFKRTEATKRKTRSEYKERGKAIPKYLKESRGVYSHLMSESWIFDIGFLAEVVETNADPRIKNRELRNIRKKYSSINNREKHLKLIEKLV